MESRPKAEPPRQWPWMIVSRLRADVSARFVGRGDHSSEPWPGIRRWKIVHVTSVHSAHDPRILEKECRSLAEQGHEVVLVYAAEFADRQRYAQAELPGQESDGEAFVATWRSLDSFDDTCRLVPEGLLALLASAT